MDLFFIAVEKLCIPLGLWFTMTVQVSFTGLCIACVTERVKESNRQTGSDGAATSLAVNVQLSLQCFS